MDETIQQEMKFEGFGLQPGDAKSEQVTGGEKISKNDVNTIKATCRKEPFELPICLLITWTKIYINMNVMI